MKRAADVYGATTSEVVARYLPAGYEVIGDDVEDGRLVVHIEGIDEAGWGLDDYVIPRLASGLYFAKEVECEQDEPEFTSCGRGRNAPGDCPCDDCVTHGDDEYHRRKEEGYY